MVLKRAAFCAQMRIETWKWTITAADWSDLHWHCSHAGSQCFIFHQDGALAQMARVTQDWLQANCLWFIVKNHLSQILQIWTQWTITYGVSCYKSTINSSWSPRRLMNWKSLCRPSATKTHQQGGGKLHQALDCLRCCQWLSLRVSTERSISKSVSSSQHQTSSSAMADRPREACFVFN